MIVDVGAAPLSVDERQNLIDDVGQVFSRYNLGDPEPFIRKSHPLVYQYAGGQKEFEAQVRQAVQAFSDKGVTLATENTGVPSEIIIVDGGEVCFVPRTIRLSANGRQARQTTYVVAIRDVSPQWRYVDGGAFRTNPGLLFTMLPFLPKDISLPPNTFEVLE